VSRPSLAWQALTGQGAVGISVENLSDDQIFDLIRNSLAAGDQVCIGTKVTIPPGVLYYYRSRSNGDNYPKKQHAYLVDNAIDNTIQLLNPWGYNSLDLESRHLSDVVSEIFILNSTKVQ
jgi:hypothetical protein